MGIVLDINTPRGQRSLVYERRAASIIKSHWDCGYVKTPPDKMGVIDAVIVRDDLAVAVCETKARDVSLDLLRNEYRNQWLVTLNKVLQSVDVAKLMCVEFWGFVYLIPDDVVLRIKIWSPEDRWLVPFRVEKTRTPAGINGGEAMRDNAYIDMTNADVLRPRPAASQEEVA